MISRETPMEAMNGDRSGTNNAPPAFDPVAFGNALPTRMGIDSPFASKLIGLFEAETERLLGEIDRACATADTQTIFRAAHSLKSSGASMGAGAFAEIARKLETLTRAGQADGLADHAARLRHAYEQYRVDPVIRDLLAVKSADRSAA